MVTRSVVNPNNPQVDRHAQNGHPHHTAVLPDDAVPSYAQGSVSALAAALATFRMRPQERVLIVMPDESGFEEAIIGTIQLAAVPLPVNPSLSAEDLVTVAAEAGTRLAVVSAQRTDVLDDLSTELVVPVDGPQGTWATVLLLG